MRISVDTQALGSSDRERFISAMIALCVERGYAGASVEALCERSGLEPSRFERLFGREGGLEECMLAAVGAIVGNVFSVVSSIYSADLSEWDSGILGLRAILEYWAANPTAAYFAEIIAANGGPQRVRQAPESARQSLAAMIDRLRANAEGEDAPRGAARAALGSAEGLVRREISAGRAEQLPRLLPELIYAATVPFLGQDEALRMSRRAQELLRGTAWGFEAS